VLTGAVLLTIFVYESLHSDTPLMNLHLFRDRSYSAVTITSLMSSAAMFSAMVIGPFYFQLVRGEDATHTALLVAPVSVGVVLVVGRAGRISDRYGGGRLAVAGLILGALSLLPFTMFDEHTSYALIIFCNVLRGVGFGAVGIPLFAVAFASLGEANVRDGSAQLNIVQRVGSSLGTAIATVVLQQALTQHANTPAGRALAFQHTFWWLTAISLIALVPASWLWHVERTSGLRKRESITVDVLALEASTEPV
jgi:MFS family permease